MTRAERIAAARKLKSEGLTNRQIGKRLGVSNSTVWVYLNPEEAREKIRRSNLRRRAVKRAWDRQHRAPCPRCGRSMGAGTGGRTTLAGVVCQSCRADLSAEARRERDEQIVRWWAEGLPLRQIGEELGWTVNRVGTEIHLLRERGYDLPYRKRPSKPKHPELVRSHPRDTVPSAA